MGVERSSSVGYGFSVLGSEPPGDWTAEEWYDGVVDDWFWEKFWREISTSTGGDQ